MASSHLPTYQTIAPKINSRTSAARYPAGLASRLAVDALAHGGRSADVNRSSRRRATGASTLCSTGRSARGPRKSASSVNTELPHARQNDRFGSTLRRHALQTIAT
jgi:hypothetical protein